MPNSILTESHAFVKLFWSYIQEKMVEVQNMEGHNQQFYATSY